MVLELLLRSPIGIENSPFASFGDERTNAKQVKIGQPPHPIAFADWLCHA
jgi:hypothetical protein